MDLGLTGKHALVCGGSRGLGGAIAEALVGEGAMVALAARDSDRLHAHAQHLGGFAIAADLSTADGPARVIREAVEHFGSLDLLVVNSGGPPAGVFGEVDERAGDLRSQEPSNRRSDFCDRRSQSLPSPRPRPC
jgi:3-oxoacyl-[acyl-carrier protein] reductase